MLEWNTLLLDCSSQRGEHFWNWHIWSISNGSRDNSSTRSQRVSIPRHPFVISATITRDPGMLEWNTLLLDCSSQRGEHFWNWHIWSISNGSRDNSSTRSQRVSIPRHPFVISATITRDPGMLEWNILLIDCSSQRGEHFRIWHIRSISNGSRDNSSTRSQRVSNSSTTFWYISNNNSRSRHARVKHSITRLFLSTRRTSLKLTYLIYLLWFSK